jgi:hypothetical protein
MEIHGSVRDINAGPSLVLWLLWTLLTSIALFRRARTESAPVREQLDQRSVGAAARA